jgi:5'-phosphate synthase pdxT subunit
MSFAPSQHPLTIGVLALQGAFEAHARILRDLGVTTKLLRTPEGLEGIDGLIMPGGESTTMLKSLERNGFFEALAVFAHTKPVFGTCAGAILLATDVAHSDQPSLKALDITVERNAYGRQNESAILSSETNLPGPPLEMVFIRAPRISRVGPGVQTLAKRGDDPVLVRSGNIMAATFHPELSSDERVHRMFVDLVAQSLK